MGLIDDLMKQFSNNQNNQNKQQLNNMYGNVNSAIVGTSSGVSSNFTEEEALSISSVAAATDLITSTIARLPIRLYKKGSKGEYVSLDDDKRVFLLNKEPNTTLTAITLKKRIILDYLFHGNSYIYPEWNRNELMGLHHIPAKNVFVEKYVDENIPFAVKGQFEVLGADAQKITLLPDELMIVLKNSENGLDSKGILDLNSELLQLALNQQQYSSSILENGALPLAVLTTPSRVTDKAMARIKQSWETIYKGGKNAGKTVILEDGMDYKPVSLNPNELDLSTSKEAVLSDIARVFGIPESMLNADANKYNSNEQNNLHFLQYTLDPIITALESALNKSLLLESEKDKGYSFQVDRDSILATTEAEKFATTIQAMKGGLISVNEARARHNLKQITDDYMMWGLGNIFYNKEDSKMTIPNMGAIIDPNDPESVAKAMNKDSEQASNDLKDKQKEQEKENTDKDDNEEKTDDEMNEDKEDKDKKSNKDKDIKEDK